MARTRCLIALLFLVACTAGEPERFPLPSLDGTEVEALDPGDRVGILFLFLGTECPIAQAYSPEIADIASEFANEIATRVVLVDRSLQLDAARDHATSYSLPAPVLLDPEHRLVARLGATITPEAVLVDHDGRVVYSGRIDDRFVSLGRARPTPRQRDLRDAMDALRSGHVPASRHAPAVGCRIE